MVVKSNSTRFTWYQKQAWLIRQQSGKKHHHDFQVWRRRGQEHRDGRGLGDKSGKATFQRIGHFC